MRCASGCQRESCLIERVCIEVNTAHGERILIEVPPALRLCGDEQIDCFEQRAVATAHIRHNKRLILQRRLVEDALHVHVHHVGKIAVMHKARANHIELSVDPRLVPPFVLEHRSRVAEARVVERVEHWSIREAHAEGRASLDDEQARLAQPQHLRGRFVRAPLLHAEEVTHREGGCVIHGRETHVL